MIFRAAAKLHNEDEVVCKANKEILRVSFVEIEGKNVYITCTNGQTYHHTEIK